MDNDIKNLAKKWVLSKTLIEIPQQYYCATQDVFQARLNNMVKEIIALKKINEGAIYMAEAVTGEIGNNSFDHNIGNWPDVAGIFFGYNINGGVEIVLADRGRGIMETLRQVKPEIVNDQEALRVAFFERITGRAPEARGNGLKFVRESVKEGKNHLTFFSGDARAKLNQEFILGAADNKIRGCLAIINFSI